MSFIQVEYLKYPCHIEECDFVVMLVQKKRVLLVNGFSFEGFGHIFVDFSINDWLECGGLEIVLNIDSKIDTVDILEDIDQIPHYFISVLGRVVKVLEKTVSDRKFGF